MTVERDHASRDDADGSAAGSPPATVPARLTFDEVYAAWFHPVCRWLRALGGPDTDLDDLAQEVFLVVQRKLGAFDGRNLPGWLYTITTRTLGDHRRRRWFRSRLQWRQDVNPNTMEERSPGALESLEQREARELLYQLLGQLNERRRETFVLFEVEEMSGEEIARLLGIPVATVWTRLHQARKEFEAIVKRHRMREDHK